MQLSDYVLAIGNRVCTLINQITTINATLANHEGRITANEEAIEVLEGGSTLTLPEIRPVCVLPPILTSIDAVLEQLEIEFCGLQDLTGNPVDITTALQAACVNATDNKLGSPGLMNTIAGWVTTPLTLAQSVSNLWKTVCDLRDSVLFIQQNCCNTTCADIDLIVTATVVDASQVRLDFNGTIPSNYEDGVGGATLTLTNVGGGSIQTVNNVLIWANHYDLGPPLFISLAAGVTGAEDININIATNFFDSTNLQSCNESLLVTTLGTNSCPTLIITPNFFGVNFAFTWLGTTPISMAMKLLNQTGQEIASYPLNVIGSNVTGFFTNLLEGNTYQLQLEIGAVQCDPALFNTLEFPCGIQTVTNVVPNYTNLTGDQDHETITAWIAEYDTYFGPIILI